MEPGRLEMNGLEMMSTYFCSNIPIHLEMEIMWIGQKNPGSMIRQLPDNAHLFYGSFDNSYRNDVLARKNAVQSTLNADEELKWKDQESTTLTKTCQLLVEAWVI